MAIGGITSNNPVLFSILVRRGNALLRPILPQAGKQTPTQPSEAIEKSALLVSDTLRDIGLSTEVALEFLPINIIPPALEAAEFTEQLDLVQQNELFVTETLDEFGFETRFPGVGQPLIVTVQAAAVAEEEIIDEIDEEALLAIEEQEAATLRGLEVDEEEEDLRLAAATAAAVPAAIPAVVAAGDVFGVGAGFLPPEFNPANLPLSMFPDRAPYVHVVYHFTDPAPPPAAPVPISREVQPSEPVAAIHAVGNARLRQTLRWARADEEENRAIEYETPRVSTVLAEREIRHILSRINADLAAQGLPLHLVFARDENGIALEVYDCSFSEACRLTYDVDISLNNLTGVLGNMEHESGVILDTES